MPADTPDAEAQDRRDNPRWWRAEDIATMTPETYDRHREEVLAAMAKGQILKAGRAAPKGAEVAVLPKPRIWTRDEIAALTPEEYATNRTSILDGLRAEAEGRKAAARKAAQR